MKKTIYIYPPMLLIKLSAIIILLFGLIEPSFIFIKSSSGLIAATLSIFAISIFFVRAKAPRQLYELMLIWFIGFAYLLTVLIRSDGSDLELIRRYGTVLLTILAGYFIAKILDNRNLNLYNYWYKGVLILLLVQSLIMVIQYLNFNVTSLFPFLNLDLSDQRPGGLRKYGRDGLSMDMAIMGFISVIAIFSSQEKNIKILWLLLFLVCLGASLLAGRTGIVLVVCGALILLVFRVYQINLQIIVNSVLLAVLLSVVILFAYRWVIQNLTFGDPLFRAFEFLWRGRVNSVDKLMGTHIHFPDGLSHLLFGDGQFGREGSRYVASDIGYIRIIYGSGLLGAFLVSLPFAYLLIKSVPLSNPFGLIVFITCVLGLLGNLKIIYLFSNGFNIFLFAAFFMYLRSRKHILEQKVASYGSLLTFPQSLRH